MKKITLISLFAWMAISYLHQNLAIAQCDNFPQSFEQAIKDAPVIVEGKILPKTWKSYGGEYNSDYNSAKLLVYKVLKGNFKADTIEFIRPDGSWIPRQSYGSVIGEEGIGIFFLYPADVIETPYKEILANLKFKSKLFSECSFVDYNRYTNPKMPDGSFGKGVSYYGIDTEKNLKRIIYDSIKKEAGYAYKECVGLEKKNCFFLNPNPKNDANGLAKNSQATPSISSFSPTTISAGTFDTLTIVGTNFGAVYDSTIKVVFPNADSGGLLPNGGDDYIALPKNHVISWSDTQLRILVPSVEIFNGNYNNRFAAVAGTGKIGIKVGIDPVIKSTQTLTIPYAEYTYALTDSTKIYPTKLTSNTRKGDFMFLRTPELRTDTAANRLFREAVETWRCATGVNFSINCDTTIVPPCVFTSDYKSTVGFDTLTCSSIGNKTAITFRRFKMCPDSSAYVMLSADIIFNDKVFIAGTHNPWYYDGSPNAISNTEVDFLTAATHELGHAHLVEHVDSPGELMHWVYEAGANGVSHVLNPLTDLVAGTNIVNRSIDTTVCNPYKALKKVLPGTCALPICQNIQCDDPGYPLQASFTMIPEYCINNPMFDLNSTWQLAVGTNVQVRITDASFGNVISREWNIDLVEGDFSNNEPCDLEADMDTCRSVYWSQEGGRLLELVVTDSEGCQRSFQDFVRVVAPDCTIAPINVQVKSAQISCDVSNSTCPEPNTNGMISILPFAPGIGSGCYTYYAEYHATDPSVSTAQDLYDNGAFILQSDGTIQLSCLPEGYYKIQVTDEISTCQTETIVFMPISSAPLLLTNYTTNSSTTANCTGRVTLNQINSAVFDPNQYTFAWSDCPTCNTPTRDDLCHGVHTLTVTDNYTGCHQTKNFTIHLYCPNGGEVGIGSTDITPVAEVEVFPTIFSASANIKITLNYDTKISLDVYNLYGQPVKKIIDEETKQAGEYYLQDNTNNISDGIYIYVVKACNETKGDIGIKH